MAMRYTRLYEGWPGDWLGRECLAELRVAGSIQAKVGRRSRNAGGTDCLSFVFPPDFHFLPSNPLLLSPQSSEEVKP